MFQFTGFASQPKPGYHAFSVMGCPIRISADQSVFASPRSLSQLITSFFAYESQGILHTPLLTFLQSPTTHLLPTLLTFMILLLVLFNCLLYINVATCQRTFSPVRIRTHPSRLAEWLSFSIPTKRLAVKSTFQ